MSNRIKLKGADEHDAFSRARRFILAFKKPGVAKKAKQSYARRFRKQKVIADE